MTYKLRVKIIGIKNEAGDVVVNMQCHLTDSNGIPFVSSTFNELDEFVVRAPKSSIPASNRLTYLTNLATEAIALKYNKELSALGEDGSDTLTLDTTDVEKLFLDLLVEGPGLASPSPLLSITSTTNILIDDTLVLNFTGDVVSNEIDVTGDVTLDSNVISNMSSTTNLEAGMFITGPGIPVLATVLSVISSSSVVISQNAVLTTNSASLVFTDNPESEYITSISPAIMTDRYVGMSVEGDGLQDNTTIVEVLSSDQVRISALASSTVSGSYAISGEAVYFFDTSGLTIDFTDLQKVLDIVDFDLL